MSLRRVLIVFLSLIFLSSSFLGVAYAEKVFRWHGSWGNTWDLSFHQGFIWVHMMGLSEGLMKWDKDMKVVNGMAESYTISKDGTVYTFKIRKDARWSNGDKLTARDFEFGIKYILDPKNGKGSFFGGAWYIKNAKAYAQSEISDPNQVGIKAIDDYTLQITLDGPHPDFLTTCTLPTLYPIHKASVEKLGKKAFEAGNLVTNGPYRLVSYTPNVEYVLEKNPYYYNADKVEIDKIVGKLGGDAFLMYRRNEVDLINVGPAQLPVIEKDPVLKKELVVFPQSTVNIIYILAFDHPAFDDIRVMTALQKAIDKERICKYVYRGLAKPAYSWVTDLIPGSTANDPEVIEKFKYDPESARKLLAEAGYPGGKGFPTIHFLINPNQATDPLILAVKSEWEKNLGIKVVIDNLEVGVWSVRIWQLHDEPTMSFSGASILYPDPAAPLTLNYVEGALGGSLKRKDVVEYVKLDLQKTEALKSGDTAKAAEITKKQRDILYRRSTPEARKMLNLVLQAQKTADPNKRLELYRQANKIRDLNMYGYGWTKPLVLIQPMAARLVRSNFEVPFNKYLVGFPVSFAYIKTKE